MYAGKGLGPFAQGSTMFGGKLAGLKEQDLLLIFYGKLETLGNLFRVKGEAGAALKT